MVDSAVLAWTIMAVLGLGASSYGAVEAVVIYMQVEPKKRFTRVVAFHQARRSLIKVALFAIFSVIGIGAALGVPGAGKCTLWGLLLSMALMLGSEIVDRFALVFVKEEEEVQDA
jgi:hypothetical protein